MSFMYVLTFNGASAVCARTFEKIPLERKRAKRMLRRSLLTVV